MEPNGRVVGVCVHAWGEGGGCLTRCQQTVTITEMCYCLRQAVFFSISRKSRRAGSQCTNVMLPKWDLGIMPETITFLCIFVISTLILWSARVLALLTSQAGIRQFDQMKEEIIFLN